MPNFIMSKNANRPRSHASVNPKTSGAGTTTVSRFNTEIEIPWEQAFNKFGYGDGEYLLTHPVVDSLEIQGYEVRTYQWSFHNEIIESIKKDGRELMPDNGSGFNVGYDDPRDYLPGDLIEYLDDYFYL